MIGAVIGDIIGSRFEFMDTKERDVELLHSACSFTDDTVCSAAIAAATIVSKENIALHQDLQNKYMHAYNLEFGKNVNVKTQQEIFLSKIYTKTLLQITMKYPLAGYGKMFMHWLTTGAQEPYQSLGNGILMRVSPIALMSNSLEECLYLGNISGAITHNHPEALKAAKQYLTILWICRTWDGNVKDLKVHLHEKIEELNIKIDSVESYHELGGFYVLAPDTLVRALVCVLESDNFEDTMRNVLYIGSDTDTTAAVAGAIAEIIYGIDYSYLKKTVSYFNFYNIELLQYILESYKNIEKQNCNGSLFVSNCLSDNYLKWYKDTSSLVLSDPTAQWDPLEEVDEDEYYTNADRILQKEREGFFTKIMKKLSFNQKKTNKLEE